MLIDKKEVATLKEVGKNVSLTNKRILMRADFDIPKNESLFRLERMRPSIDYILSQNPKSLTLIGHRGRPKGIANPNLSLNPVRKYLKRQYGDRLKIPHNLRFDRREEEGSLAFAKALGQKADVFAQDCFAGLHRRHTSIILLPRVVPLSCIGLNVQKELENLAPLRSNTAQRPYIAIIGGTKEETKRPLIAEFKKAADMVLQGSKYLGQNQLDLDDNTIKDYKNYIETAKTILWNGPLGQYEEEAYAKGTKEISFAIASNKQALRVAGGGDTIAALEKWHLLDKMDFVSSGGGAMLEYALGHKLPGLEAIMQNQ